MLCPEGLPGLPVFLYAKRDVYLLLDCPVDVQYWPHSFSDNRIYSLYAFSKSGKLSNHLIRALLQRNNKLMLSAFETSAANTAVFFPLLSSNDMEGAG